MKKTDEKLKINLGGRDAKEGFKEVQSLGCIKAETVEEIWCSHLLQRIPGKERAQLVEDVWRVLIPDGKAIFVTPYWTSMKAVADFRNQWPPISEMSYLFFNRKWCLDNKVEVLKCNFIWTVGYMLDGETNSRSVEAQQHWVKHYTNAVLDLHATLTKKGLDDLQ